MKIERLKIFTGHSSGIYALDYGKGFLYTGSADRFVTRWDLSTNEQDKFAIQFGISFALLIVISQE
jgi:WD40 repeat protein